MRVALDELIANCPGGGELRDCTIIDALAGRVKANPESQDPARGIGNRAPDLAG